MNQVSKISKMILKVRRTKILRQVRKNVIRNEIKEIIFVI